MSAIGDYLKEVRQRLGLTLREVEGISDVSNAYLSMIESGKRRTPHPNILRKLAKAYGEPLSKLMKLAGYLDLSEEEREAQKINQRFKELMSDPSFSFGTRLKGKIDFETKKFIVEMYSKLKKKGKR